MRAAVHAAVLTLRILLDPSLRDDTPQEVVTEESKETEEYRQEETEVSSGSCDGCRDIAKEEDNGDRFWYVKE